MAFDAARFSVPEQVHVLRDDAALLSGVIVVHSTALGPAAGGCRLWPYWTVEAATTDAVRLAEGMSYKNALADLPLGGGKAVLRRPEGAFDRERFFEAFGRAVAEVGGRYVTAEDVGKGVADMQSVARATRHVAGLPAVGLGPGGDPSPWTARGVFLAMQHAAARRLGRPLADCVVAIQGIGHVGFALACMLHEAGARLLVADITAANVDRVVAATGATAVPADAIISAQADILAPCALGGMLSHSTVGTVKARVVCGAANNQLAEPQDGARLADHGVLYAPDYVVNAGGIINVAAEYLGWSGHDARERVEGTGDRLARVLDLAVANGLPTNLAADASARSLIRSGAAQFDTAA